MNKELYLQCTCGSEVLLLAAQTDFPEVDEVWLSMYTDYDKLSLWDRIRHIFKILKTGNPYEDEMILKVWDLIKIRNFINSLDLLEGEKK